MVKKNSPTKSSGSYLLVALLIFTCGFFVLGTYFSSQSEERANFPIRIAVSKTPLSTPVYIADEKGFFQKHCGDVRLKEVVGGNRSFESMTAGKADFATSSDSVLVYKAFNRNDFVALASFVQSDNDVKFITLEDSIQMQGRDLTNKKIAVVKGSASEYFLSTFLALEGVSSDTVTLVGMPPNEMPDALELKVVDAIVPWEPFGFKTMQKLEGRAKVIPTKNLYSLTFNLVALKADVEARPEASECVLKSLSEAIDFISVNPHETHKIIASRLNLNSDFIFWIWPDYLFKLSLNRSLLMNLKSQAQWVVSTGDESVQTLPDFMSLLNPEPLMRVKPEAASLPSSGEDEHTQGKMLE